jgi:hypothetical protein
VERTVSGVDVGRRHPTLDRLEGWLGDIARGAAAATVEVGGEGGLAVLPTVIWMEGPAGHAKAHRGLLPYPVRWDVPLVVLLAPESRVTLRWKAAAWGVQRSGEVELVCSRIAPTVCSIGDVSKLDDVPERVWVGVGSAARLRWHVTDLVEQAGEARWNLHAELAGWLRQSLTTAHRAVSADLQVRRCVDDTGFDEVLAEIELGTPASPGLIDRVIARLTDARTSRPSVDSARYIVTTFRRDAELALRRRLDDPRWVGTAFRSFARQNPHLSGRQLVAAFNESGCLSERIGMARAVRALQPAVAPDHVELMPERVACVQADDERLDVDELAAALSKAFAACGGLTGAAKRITESRDAVCDEALAALAKAAGTKRTLSKLARMEERVAAAWLATKLVEAA